MASAPTQTISAPPTAGRPASAPAPSSQAAAAVGIDLFRILQGYYPFLILALVLGIAVGAAAFIGLGYVAPQYTSQVVFQAMPAQTEPGQSVDATLGDNRNEVLIFMETNVAYMADDQFLRSLAGEPDVRNTQWAKQFVINGNYSVEEALKKLRTIVVAKVIPDTTLFQFAVRTPDRDSSFNIAATAQRLFLDFLRSSAREGATAMETVFSATIRAAQAEVSTLDTQMENLLQAQSLTSLSEKESIFFQEMMQLQPVLVATREQLAQSREQLRQFVEMRDAPGPDTYPESIRVEVERLPIIQQIDANIATEKAGLRAAKEAYGDNHPDVKRRERTLRALEEERSKNVESQMRDLFQAQLEGLDATNKRLEASEKQIVTRIEDISTRLNTVTTTIKQYETLKQRRDVKQQEIITNQAEITKLQMIRDRGPRAVTRSSPVRAEEKSFPKLIPIMALSLLGFVGGTGAFILLREIREQRVRSPQDIAMIPRTPVLGVIPEADMDPDAPDTLALACVQKPRGVLAESFRLVRNAIVKACAARGHKTVLVMSAMPESGATTVVSNVACNAAASDLRVLVIDANFRRPALDGIFKVNGAAAGLGDILAGQATLESAAQATEKARGISVLTAGKSENRIVERLSTVGMASLIAQAREAYDLVLIDCAPAVVASDGMALASYTDASVLVVKAFSEKRGLVARLRNQLGDMRAEFLGVVVNAVRASAGGYLRENIKRTQGYAGAPSKA